METESLQVGLWQKVQPLRGSKVRNLVFAHATSPSDQALSVEFSECIQYAFVQRNPLMSKTVTELAKKVVQLPVKDRAYLAERLLARLESDRNEPRSLQRMIDEAESS